MCLIIINKKGKRLSKLTLDSASKLNPHGLGITWLDDYTTIKLKSKQWAILQTNRPYIAHFRYATIGKVNKENVHPFKIPNTDESLYQNGTIHELGNTDKCDTQALAELLPLAPRRLWKKALAKYDCRFVTINTRKKFYQIFNREKWTKLDGILFSNTRFKKDTLVAVYGTLKKNGGNHHLLTAQNFVGKGITAFKFPMVSRGIPYVIDEKGKGNNIKVEVYKVNKECLARLDSLEGHPNHYERRKTPIKVKGKTLNCWLYFNDKIKYKDEELTNEFKVSKNYFHNWYYDYTYTPTYTPPHRTETTPQIVRETEKLFEECPTCAEMLDYDSHAEEFYCHNCLEYCTPLEDENYNDFYYAT